MAAFLRVTSTAPDAQRKLRALARALTPTAQNMVIQRVAWAWHARMTLRTPKRWTGHTAKSWKVKPHREGDATGYRVYNDSKVMRHLEYGTRAHGPAHAKLLFIPLTRKAAEAGARGVMRANRQHSLNRTFGVARTRRRAPFVAGVDFVFAKRVRGIKALHLVRDAAPFMRQSLQLAMVQFIRAVVASA